MLIDPGIRRDELACLANDLRELDAAVVAGFSTHPHWDHLLWSAEFGSPPRYATARAAATARERLSGPDAAARVAAVLPPDIADQIPLDLLGQITGVAVEATDVPWDGPRVRIIEHQAHAPGHTALFIEERGVLVAGDMLSDALVPMLDVNAADPFEDYLAALRLFEEVADKVDVVIPGHGSVGGVGQVRARIEQDRAYVVALRETGVVEDPRIGASVAPEWQWVTEVHDRQAQRLASRSEGGTNAR